MRPAVPETVICPPWHSLRSRACVRPVTRTERISARRSNRPRSGAVAGPARLVLRWAAAVVTAAAGLGLLGAAQTAGAAGNPHPLCVEALARSAEARSGTEGVCGFVATAGPPADQTYVGGTGLDALADAVRSADMLLLGEMHDNPVHHRARAALIRRFVQAGPVATPARRPALVFEHIRADQQATLDAVRAEGRASGNDARPSSGDYLEALAWEQSGWPDARMFEPLFELMAGSAGLPAMAGDGARADIPAIARNGLQSVPVSVVERLGLAEPLPAPLQADLLAELAASHCGLMPAAAFSGLADAQRYRDAHLARALADAQSRHGQAVLLAGNGHVRSDRGVPWHLRRLAPAQTVVTVALREVDPQHVTIAAYIDRGPGGHPTADYVVLTTQPDRIDPCIAMRRRFGK